MGLIDKIIGKHARVVAQREEACEAAKAFADRTEQYITSMNEKFIDVEWAEEQKCFCRKQIEEFSKLTKYAIKARKRLKEARGLLEKLTDDVEERVQKHNESVAQLMIPQGRNIIGDVEGRQLDDQQMACIVKPSHNHLVIAGAGTGKTTTIVGKIKYLLNSGKCKPEDILVLSFTNASASEMSERIKKETKCNITASTFHKLGLGIMTKVEGTVPKISRINLVDFCKSKLIEKMNDSKYMELLCNYFLWSHKYNKTEEDFNTKEEYTEYLRLNPPITLRGETVKSYGEMDIANFLYRNGIEYEYEKEYEIDTRTGEHAQYYPDFYLSASGIYLEYFGIDRRGMVPSYFSSTGDVFAASKEYRESMAWKRKVHKENNTTLLEVYAYEKAEGDLLSKLEDRLKKAGVAFNPLSPEQLWEDISNSNSKDTVSLIAELISTIITLIKSNNYNFDQFKEKCLSQVGLLKSGIVLKLVEPIFYAYLEELEKNQEIDFNDMINKSTELIRSGAYINPFRYVIVDEYQDISKARFNLLKALRDSSGYDLFCVGDDWQSIYRFAGSDMGYILNFKLFWGPTTISKIETTYRFSQSLIDISGQFVMQNPAQFKKSIKGCSNDFSFALGEINGYNEQTSVKNMLRKLDELPMESTVYFIGRYSFDAKMLDSCQKLRCNYDNAHGVVNVSYNNRQDLKMTFISAHRSKGLQADYVFIINNKGTGMGFPSMIQDDPVVEVLLEGKEDYPYAEERRLFYVALTRARKKTFILTIDNKESVFAKELEDRYRVQLGLRENTCPICKGRLVVRTARTGKNAGKKFYGCSNYPTCTYVENI